MTVRHLISAGAALLVLLGVGCRRNDSAGAVAETDEPYYVRGIEFKKQERKAEALTAFLKVIARRGELPSPESHIEAGLLYLEHTKDPVEAYHHFKRYLDLQPNSKQAAFVTGRVEVARREFLVSLLGPNAANQGSSAQRDEELARLRRENSELRAELQTLRGGVMPSPRSARAISLPDDPRPAASPPSVAVNDSPLTPAPLPNRAVPAPAIQSAPLFQKQPAVTPSPAPTRAAPTPLAPARGRTYTVRQREGLLAIARQFDPANPGRKMREIVAANPDVLPDGERSTLKAGMVLRIP
jgi:tetratricopeptide (TPR) repeat protein